MSIRQISAVLGSGTMGGDQGDRVRMLGVTIWLMLAAVLQLPLALNHDAAWHFQMSFRLLAGDVLGRDVLDINPPMSAWLFMLPALVVQTTGLSPAVVFKLFSLVVCGLAYLATLSLLNHVTPRQSRTAVAFALGALLFVMPGYHFGQREHLVTAFVLPYAALAMLRERDVALGTLPTLLIGITAAIGICIKPYFLAVPVSVECWLFLHTQRRAPFFRVETVTMVMFGIAYLAAVAIWAPYYYLRVVPDALSNYHGFEGNWPDVLFSTLSALGPGLFCFILGWLIWGKHGGVPRTAAVALAAACGFLIAALLQKKGWYYQFYPALLFLMLAAVLLFAHRDGGVTKDRAKTAAAVVIFTACTVPGCIAFVINGHAPNGISARVTRLEWVFRRYARPEDSVFAFITSPRDIHPAVLESGRRWAGAAGAMVYLPAAVNSAAWAEGQSADPTIELVAKRERDDLLTALLKQPPAVIAIDDKPNKLGIDDPAFDYIAYFQRYPQFRQLWQGYSEIAGVPPFRFFVRQRAQATIGAQAAAPTTR